ncbi:NAD-dependent epimerase/dehydratase family protein, partial [Clostridioides difficile]|uniref:NAD-dependent epimerase/dehydratase family protein n=1 Tax=Clostridioides difficile TaxID=1496 RepID=UPI003F8D20CA
GAGYIGSHTAIELLESGYEVVIVDNLSNSNSIVVDRIKELSNQAFANISASTVACILGFTFSLAAKHATFTVSIPKAFAAFIEF